MNQTAIIKHCKELGCCDVCCLRYLGLKSPTAYENVSQFILKICHETSSQPQHSDVKPQDLEVKPEKEEVKPQPEKETTDRTPEEQNIEATQGDTEYRSLDTDDCSGAPPPKKMKTNGVCVSCIGVLQEENWPQCYNMVKDMLDRKGYECGTFACALSAPIATILRERFVSLHLKEAFPEYDDACVTPLKEAWKWSFGAGLARCAGKALHSGAVAPLLVTLHMEYPDECEAPELELLKTLAPALFETRRAQRRRFAVELTRRAAEQALAGAALDALRGAGWLEAPRPLARARCVSVVCAHAPLYLGGRYIKLSRTLPQTPWLVNGRRMMHSSVQETICEPIAALYRLSAEETEHRLKFMSAGREDVDVRCLGDGRPFAIEITDPTREPSEAELSELCARISEGGQVIVKSLVPVSREQLAQLKQGEETKCKTYEALCIKLTHSANDRVTVSDPSHTPVVVTARDLDNINTYSNAEGEGGARVVLAQRTPIRVLHRRPLLTRARRILALSAHAVPAHPQLFVLRVRTDAGTYVKEWAHGDAGRTAPSLADALGARADILALDVASVELPWPAAATAAPHC